MRKILFIVIAFAAGTVGMAQWMPDPAINNAVVTTSSSTAKAGLVSASDGAGGMFIGWIDSRVATSQSIYVQRILANGTLKFTSEVVVTAAGNDASGTQVAKGNLSMVADGVGGVICVWEDKRNIAASSGGNNDIYGQRIDADGNALWTAGGKRVTVSDNSTSSKTVPAVEMVSSTEAVVVYADNTSGTLDLYAQKITISNGNTVWVNDVALHGSRAGTQNNHALLADGAGGLFLVYQDAFNGNSNIDVYSQRIDNSGTILWGASGNAIATGANNQLTPQLVSDGAGGIVTVWSDARLSAGDANIYAQRFNSGGVAQWTAGGELINNSANLQTHPLIINSGSNYIISWNDNRAVATGNRNIYAQSINGSGTLLWTPSGGAALEGIAIVTATGNQPSNAGTMQLLNDGLNNAILIWEDARLGSSSVDVYAQKINTSGVVQWQVDGIPVATATGNQAGPVAVLSTNNSVITAWRDSRTATNGEIYASRIESSGVLPLQSITLNATLKNGTVELKWNTIGEINAANHFVEKSSNGINFSSIGSNKARGFGNGSYNLNDAKLFKGTMYYRIRSVDVNGAFSYSPIVQVQYNGTATPTLSFYPNPVKTTAYLQLTGFQHGNAAVIVRELSGKTVHTRTTTINTDFQVINLPLTSVAAGTYIIEIRAANGFIATKLVIKE